MLTLLLQLGRNKEAVAVKRDQVGMNEDDPAEHASLGVILQGIGWNRQALEAFDNALRLDPSFFARHTAEYEVYCRALANPTPYT